MRIRLEGLLGTLANFAMFSWCGMAPVFGGGMALQQLGKGTFLGALLALGCGSFGALGIVWAQGYLNKLNKNLRKLLLGRERDSEDNQDDSASGDEGKS